jgi:diadenosine tetraphosphate (Ap4A) HIT family hydrolase
VFCDIVAKKSPAHIVYEDDDLIAFLDNHPIADGYTLVLKKRHYERLGEIPRPEVVNLFSKVQSDDHEKMSAQGGISQSTTERPLTSSSHTSTYT